MPDCVDKLATAIAGGQSKGGEAAQALAEKLKESGWFSHGLSGDYPSTAGHGNYRIDQLLAGTAMVGDSEQYASAMALMARSLGLPSRVVLGFLPKDDEGEISESRTEEQGTTTITKFTGNDVTAWVEIKLDGYGWVAFYPTPKETKVPDENQNLTPPNPQTLVRQPPVPLTDPLRDDTQAKGKSSIGGSMADETSANLFWQHFGRIARKVAIYGSPLWTLLIICGLLLAIKAIALARSRKHGSTQQRVAAGWQSVAALARQSGLDIRGTRSEQAVSIANQMDISRRDLARFGRASPITRPSPVISSTKSMCSSIGAILRRNASTCSSHCRRYADGVPNFRLPTFSTSAATAAGGTTAAIGSTIVRKDGTHDLP